MELYTGTEYDGVGRGDMDEYGRTPDVGGGAYYQSLMRQQLAQNRLVEQVKRDDSETPLTDTWDSRQPDTAIDHVRAFEFKHAGVPNTKKKPKRAEPTVRLRKAMGLPLRKGEPLFDKDFPETLPIK